MRDRSVPVVTGAAAALIIVGVVIRSRRTRRRPEGQLARLQQEAR